MHTTSLIAASTTLFATALAWAHPSGLVEPPLKETEATWMTTDAPIISVDRVRYEVAPGDTLGRIAREYGVSVDDLRRWNRLDGDQIVIGQTLTIRVRGGGGGGDRIREEYTVRSGDTGGAIARRNGVTLDQLRRWNPSANLDRIRIGQTLVIYRDGGSGSTGRPNRGRLRGGVAISSEHGYRVRNSETAYGTPHTISAIRNGFARVSAHFIDQPDVVIADVSREHGGSLGRHLSHQNGLDADIGYYQHDCPDNECEYTEITPEEMRADMQWYLFSHWIDEGLVQYIFIDYELQVPLYEYARARGATEEQLAEWFEYPRHGAYGIIRDEPGHDDHFHVRFWPEATDDE